MPFPIWQILLAAIVAFIASLIALLLLRQRAKTFPVYDGIIIALVVGFALFAWRMAANVALLNDDPIPGISPNDMLCPVVVYFSLSMYAALRQPPARWAQIQVLLTVLAFFTSVVVL
ncbi:MAG: hypothetical protein E6J34_15150 [Chloroflexi bacterium]|nr:MAG: hypothetical protein E6J34_15150 [Chloroflexota bacterium]